MPFFEFWAWPLLRAPRRRRVLRGRWRRLRCSQRGRSLSCFGSFLRTSRRRWRRLVALALSDHTRKHIHPQLLLMLVLVRIRRQRLLLLQQHRRRRRLPVAVRQRVARAARHGRRHSLKCNRSHPQSLGEAVASVPPTTADAASVGQKAAPNARQRRSAARSARRHAAMRAGALKRIRSLAQVCLFVVRLRRIRGGTLGLLEDLSDSEAMPGSALKRGRGRDSGSSSSSSNGDEPCFACHWPIAPCQPTIRSTCVAAGPASYVMAVFG